MLLEDLNIDQLCQFCRNVGVNRIGSANKFNCRRALYVYFTYASHLKQSGAYVDTASTRNMNTNLRVINGCFHPSLCDLFLKVNDAKYCKDHEEQTMFKQFWVDLALLVNSEDSREDLLAQPSSDDTDSDLDDTHSGQS